jgi:hypothetical protein
MLYLNYKTNCRVRPSVEPRLRPQKLVEEYLRDRFIFAFELNAYSPAQNSLSTGAAFVPEKDLRLAGESGHW